MRIMNLYSRRQFISNTAAASAGVSLFSILPQARAAGSANDEIGIGLVGLGWKGGGHLKSILKEKGVRIVAICDPDTDLMAQGQEVLKEAGQNAREYRDMRHMFDDSAVDAVVISTPNHWHALATIWACQAGKDVYVEKPVTHNLWEGGKMVEAARKYGRMVQAGTQNRSDVGFRAAMKYINEGNLGKMLWTHGFWYKYRPDGDTVTGPQPIPLTVDYNLWTGPAPLTPLMRKNLHYDWHWHWDTGNGDFGNLGGHKVDDSMNVIGANGPPTRFLCIGGLYGHNNDGWQTPNIEAVFIEFENKPPVIVDVRSLPAKAGAKYEVDMRKARKGNVIQCEGGYFTGGRGGGILYDNDGNRIKQFPGDGGKTHFQNWVDAIRTRNRNSMLAEIELSVNSASICHLANIAYRSGLPTTAGDIVDAVGSCEHSVETVEGIVKQVRDNGFDLDKSPLTCSGWMTYDAGKMKFSGGSDYGQTVANALVQPHYRAPFIVPDRI